MEFTLSDESEKSKKKELNSAELTKQLDKLIQDQADNQRIFDWVEVGIPACVYFPVLFYFHLHFPFGSHGVSFKIGLQCDFSHVYVEHDL